MRRVCHEIAHLEEGNRSYRDGVLFKLLRENLEFVIRDTSGSSWSIDKCRHDLRCRPRGALRIPRTQIDRRLQKELRQRLLPSIGEDTLGKAIGSSL